MEYSSAKQYNAVPAANHLTHKLLQSVIKQADSPGINGSTGDQAKNSGSFNDKIISGLDDKYSKHKNQVHSENFLKKKYTEPDFTNFYKVFHADRIYH